jgi:class 3 adenylate cyclase
VRDDSIVNHAPSATATFLFTDIEGSTQLLTRLRERYADVLEEHHRLLRAIFAAHGGQEIDTQRDAFFVAFPRAQDAVTAAAEIQRTVRAIPGQMVSTFRCASACTRARHT